MSKIGSSREAVEARTRFRTDSGQVTMFLALAMGIFLVAFVGFATDYTTFWYQRQAIQGATDATCQAAAVDLLRYALSDQTPNMHFTPSAGGVSCTASPTAAPCLIAAYNGYNAALSGVSVAMSFPPPGTVYPNVTAAPGVTWPYVQVDITNRTSTYFSSLLTQLGSVNVHASATCGLVQALGASQVLVLDPFPQITTFTFNGAGNLKVIGGSAIGVQLNADSIRAAKFTGTGKADLSLGGLDNSGSDFGVTGTEANPGMSFYNPGTKGIWNSPDTPELNPYANLSPPSGVVGNNPAHNGSALAAGVDGCNDSVNGCLEYSPGYYLTGITYAGSKTMIFDPGVYYLNGSLNVTGAATLRMGSGAQTSGVMFYFNQGTLNIGVNSGTSGTAGSVPSTALTCDASLPPGSLGIPALLSGNVLTAECTNKGTYWDPYGDTSDSVGNVRGVLFFQDLANTSILATSCATTLTPPYPACLYGNSTSIYTGAEYFHNSTYVSTLIMASGSTDALSTWGNIVVDNLTISGANEMKVLLGGVGTSTVSRVAMIQ